MFEFEATCSNEVVDIMTAHSLLQIQPCMTHANFTKVIDVTPTAVLTELQVFPTVFVPKSLQAFFIMLVIHVFFLNLPFDAPLCTPINT